MSLTPGPDLASVWVFKTPPPHRKAVPKPHWAPEASFAPQTLSSFSTLKGGYRNRERAGRRSLTPAVGQIIDLVPSEMAE